MTPLPHPDVLVVDDSRMMRALIARGLRTAGVPESAIIQAENGAVALDRVREHVPGLVVTDVHMPTMTGTEFLQQLSAEGYLDRLPVVVVTSLSSSRLILDFIRLGAAAVIRKPIDAEGLARELAPFVSQLQAPPQDDQLVPVERAPDEPDVVDLDAVLEVAALGVLRANRFVEAQRIPAIERQQRVLLGAMVALHEPVVGHVTCWADLEAAGALAEAMAGAAPEDDDTARVDAIAELCNQLVGSFFAQIALLEGDPLFESDFGIPARFVVAPGQPLPPYHQAFRIGPNACVICHIDIAATEPVAPEVSP